MDHAILCHPFGIWIHARDFYNRYIPSGFGLVYLIFYNRCIPSGFECCFMFHVVASHAFVLRGEAISSREGVASSATLRLRSLSLAPLSASLLATTLCFFQLPQLAHFLACD